MPRVGRTYLCKTREKFIENPFPTSDFLSQIELTEKINKEILTVTKKICNRVRTQKEEMIGPKETMPFQ